LSDILFYNVLLSIFNIDTTHLCYIYLASLQVVDGIIRFPVSIVNCLNAIRCFSIDTNSHRSFKAVRRSYRIQNNVRDVLDIRLTVKGQGAELFVLSKDEVIDIDLSVVKATDY